MDALPPTPDARRGTRLRTFLVLVVVLGVGVARIASTHVPFSQTVDEPSHLAGGLEWLEYGSSWSEPKHPPLARAAAGVGPYLAGLRLSEPPPGHRVHTGIIFRSGNAVLEARGQYDRNLQLARLGILPFFIIGCLAVWSFTRQLFGVPAAVGAVIAAATSPMILAHAGLATTDAALAATMMLAVFVMAVYLARPSRNLALAVGATTALALVSKMSAVAFFPPVVLVLVALTLVTRRARLPDRPPFRAVDAPLALASLGLVVWAAYRFSIGTLLEVDPRLPEHAAETLGPSSSLIEPLMRAARLRVIPAVEWFAGVKDLLASNEEGTKGYLWGMVYLGGHPLYFPVGIVVKTPLPLLILEMVGLGLAFAAARKSRNWLLLAPAGAALAILAVAIPSKINIGVRHVLPVFLLLTPYAGLAAGRLASRAARPGYRVLGFLLVAWHLWSTTRIHPDYLAYFNELASLSREPVLVNSDLDWGQDGKRLVRTVREVGIDSLHVGYFGTVDLRKRGLVSFDTLRDYAPASGWVAISVNRLTLGRALEPASDQFAWIKAYRPERTIGRSILLYRIPGSERTSSSLTAAEAGGGGSPARRNPRPRRGRPPRNDRPCRASPRSQPRGWVGG